MEKRKKRFIRLLALALALCLCAGLCFTGCGAAQGQPGGDTPTAQDADAVALALQQQYGADSTVEYATPEYDVPRDGTFTFEIGFDPEEKGITNTKQIVGIYCDAALTQQAGNASEVEQLDNGRIAITLKPGRTPTMAVPNTYTENSRTYLLSDDPDAYRLFDKGDFGDWGNAAQYYRVQWLDFETGEALEKPIVTLFTVEHTLAAPTLEWYTTENGDAAFRWNAVEGATDYYLCKLQWQDGKYAYSSVLGHTAETSWQYDNGDIATVMNGSFVTEYTSEDDKLSATYDPDTAYVSEYETYNTFCVIAANDKDTSAASNQLRDSAMAATLPYSVALNQRKQDGEYTSQPASIGLLAAQMPITMCDGATQYRILNYHADRAGFQTYQEVTEWEDEAHTTPKSVRDVEMLVVPYTVDGTLFTGKMAIADVDAATWKKELQSVVDRQDALRGRTGTVSSQFSAGKVSLGAKDGKTDSLKKQLTKTDDKVFGSTALSAYLATAMQAGMEYIPLTAFPEAADIEVLADAWSEATYQNPLILGASGAAYSETGNALLVTYDDVATMPQKQKEIREEVRRVTAKIITPDMTNLEKELAINQYLCDSAEYDYDALANAETYNYEKVDEKFNDSFTAYGILINKKGVCASYAAAFKLLADAAGLDSIVVTGYLNGSLPHAWNRVNIDGEWRTVDVTNNDNPDLFNALFNLPDDVAQLALAEDDRFMMNSAISQYTASDISLEYYHLENKWFDLEQVAGQLAQDLADDGKAVLRTEYNLDDDTFQAIAQEVMTRMERDNLYGYYWMGVISLSTEAA